MRRQNLCAGPGLSYRFSCKTSLCRRQAELYARPELEVTAMSSAWQKLRKLARCVQPSETIELQACMQAAIDGISIANL